MADTCETCGEDYTTRRCACMRAELAAMMDTPDPRFSEPGVALPTIVPKPSDLDGMQFELGGALYEVTGWSLLRWPLEVQITLEPKKVDEWPKTSTP